MMRTIEINCLPDALRVIENGLQSESMWRILAISLLEKVGDKRFDQNKLRDECLAHAQRGVDL